jgi:hypothetical protein
VVAESLNKALELFATKKVDGTLHLDLNRSASRVDARNPPPNHQEEMPDGRPISKEDEALEEEDDECGDDGGVLKMDGWICMIVSSRWIDLYGRFK